MFGQHIIRWFELGIDLIIPVISCTAQQIIQVKRMVPVQLVIQVCTDNGQRTLIMTERTVAAGYFIS